MAFIRRGEDTILSRRRFTHPLQALEPVRAEDGSLYLMMLNTSGGLVGGDRLRTAVDIGPDAAVALTTASASKAYRSTGAAAIQESIIRIGRGATLEYLPEHLIPHPGSIVHQSLRVEMEAGSRAIIYDAIAAGRIGRGERWDLTELRSETILTRESHPLYISRVRIAPTLQSPSEIGLAQGFDYLGGLIIVADHDAGRTPYQWSELSDAIDAALRDSPTVYGGVSELACGGSAVRLMARRAADLNVTVHRLWAIARRFLLGLDAFDWRKF